MNDEVQQERPEPAIASPGTWAAHRAAPTPRRQFQPGQRVRDSYGRSYRVDANGSLRREDGGEMSKAERKAAKKKKSASRQDAKAQSEV